MTITNWTRTTNWTRSVSWSRRSNLLLYILLGTLYGTLCACNPNAYIVYRAIGEAEIRNITRQYGEPWGTLPPPPSRLLGEMGYTDEEHIIFFRLDDELTGEPYYWPRSVYLYFNFFGSYSEGYPIKRMDFEIWTEDVVPDDACIQYWELGAMRLDSTVDDDGFSGELWMDGNELPNDTPMHCRNNFQLDMSFRSTSEPVSSQVDPDVSQG